MTERIALYAGTFDPVTNGHLWVVKTAAAMFDQVHFDIGENPAKSRRFPVADSLAMMREAVAASGLGNVTVGSYGGEYTFRRAQALGARWVVRGVRTAEDFNYECLLKTVNDRIVPGIETVFIVPPAELSIISSSMVKGLVGPDGWQDIVAQMVPAAVLRRLAEAVR